MPKLDISKWEKEHKKRIEEYIKEIDALYKSSTAEMVRLGMSYPYDPEKGETFSYSSSKRRNEQAEKRLKELHDKLVTIIRAGIANEWAFANTNTDTWVRSLFPDPKQGYMLHNLQALEAFQHRKMYGHTLSNRVWEYTKQFEEQMELSLSVGISDGRSAAQISRDVRSYLNEPEKLFRRVRDRFGNLVLSKNAQAYHPGQGVYRSSYQNAMRMARTEINGAYRQSNYERWQQLDFVVGIEVKTSNTHTEWLEKFWYPRFKKGTAPLEICDAMEGRYPKDFKFIGWHPNCKCSAYPILANEGTGKDWWEGKPENVVKDVPQKFKEWMANNADRIETANRRGTLPYWIAENTKYSKVSVSPLNSSEKAQIIAIARKEFNEYGPNWKKEYFDERSGGYVVVDKNRLSKSQVSKNETAKFEKEFGMTKVFANNGYRIEMLNEISRESSSDVRIDGLFADLKRTSSHNNIVKYAKKATRNQGADIVLFQFDELTPEIRFEINILMKMNIHGKYFVTGSNTLYEF